MKENNFKMDTLWQAVTIEIENAENARKNGLEGRARVCARRAVGKAFQITGLSTSSSLSAIMPLSNIEEFPEEISLQLKLFFQKVDENFNLPPEVDLIESADKIVQFLYSFDKEKARPTK